MQAGFYQKMTQPDLFVYSFNTKLSMNTILNILFATILAVITGCSGERAHEAIATTSEKVGQTAGELVKNVSTGVEKAFNVKIELSEKLKAKGVSFGQIKVSNDSTGTDNKVSVYMIFSNDFNGEMIMKAFDNNNLEMGRIRISISAKKDEARFFDFVFDPRTNIDTDSKLTLE